MGYYPRVRAKSIFGTIRSWPEIQGPVKVQAFAGYKVGMTHVLMVDYRKNSLTAGQEVMAAVTVVEVPPLTVAGLRFYDENENGLFVSYEKWADNLDKSIFRRIPERKKSNEKPMVTKVADVRLIVHTNPQLVKSIPSKTPEIFEVRVGGGTIEERIKYAQEKLGKQITFDEFSKPGKFVDVIGVTKGKGFTGHVERFGIKLLHHKNRKHRRMIGTLGPWHPDWVRNTVPQAGQMGFQQRTVHNIRVIKYISDPTKENVNVKGGFPGYGVVTNPCVLLHGSIPGHMKRLIKMRDPARQTSPDVTDLVIRYVSTESKQGD
ncbi:50S ribosomal protein L3 [Thermogymnomonas acidicola]|uniref:50S ribosomal protein L3 n=2 Tax=Thermogymnomonas acidicola TaxID=399579 RepID=A0AA37BRP6_9ARCH|nr:50S ribosomal protein L3 [Thermogymnomonas acidicola]